MREKTLGPDHADIAAGLNSLAELYRVQSRYDKAEPCYLRAVATWQKLLGPPGGLGDLPQQPGRDLSGAGALYQGGTACPPGARHAGAPLRARPPDVAASLNTLALLYVTQAQYAKAEPLYVRAVATAEQTLGPDHAGMTVLLENYATLLRHTQRATRALTMQARAKAIRARSAQQSSHR